MDQRGRHKRHYPWDRWFGVRTTVLARGADFLGRTDTFLQQVRNQARLRGLGVTLVVSDDGQSVAMTPRPKRRNK